MPLSKSGIWENSLSTRKRRIQCCLQDLNVNSECHLPARKWAYCCVRQWKHCWGFPHDAGTWEGLRCVAKWAKSWEGLEAAPSSDREMETVKRPLLTIGHLLKELLSMWRKSHPHCKEDKKENRKWMDGVLSWGWEKGRAVIDWTPIIAISHTHQGFCQEHCIGPVSSHNGQDLLPKCILQFLKKFWIRWFS